MAWALCHGLDGMYSSGSPDLESELSRIQTALQKPTSDRLWHIADGLRAGMAIEDLYRLTHVDRLVSRADSTDCRI